MGVPRILRRVEAAKKDEKRGRVGPGIAKPSKKKRGDKLRALAGAFTADSQAAATLDPLDVKYTVHEKIGHGKQGVAVYRCTLRSTGENFAVKRVPKTQLGTTHGNERPMVEALRGNSQLVATHEVLEGSQTVDYVMELARGGDLFEWIDKNGALCEDHARVIFAGVLAGLQQVHRADMIHRDIKLENIVLMTPDAPTSKDVRLADFEFCTPAPAMGAVGSIGYAAPETLGNSSYTAAVDVWAAGVVLYAMLSASAPFDSPDDPAATAQNIREVRPGMPFVEPCWGNISAAAKDLVNRMLHPDPQQRIDVASAMIHPWLSGASAIPQVQTKPSPKFALRCTWHVKTKRWSHQGKDGPSGAGEVQMLMDEEEQCPLVACPLEWAPNRARANSFS